MKKTLIFGGTTEGRLLAEFCDENKISCTVSVATDYGKTLLPVSENVKIISGKKDCDEIMGIIKEENFSRVIDAAHPYALEVRKNIRIACEKTGAEYIRIVREKMPEIRGAVYFDDLHEAVRYLKNVSGDIFIAAGSKELPLFLSDGFPERCTVRVLPDEKIVKQCKEAGFKKIITGKGPFSYEENHAHFSGCGHILTKESGSAGGFEEKVRAAHDMGAELIVIRRREEKGIDINAAKEIMLKGKNEK